MKRKPSHEQFTQQLAFKQAAKKSRSPGNLRRPKAKFQNEVLSFLGQQKTKITKQKQECLKSELKGDSHNSTANCTFSRSRIPKPKKGRQKEERPKRQEQMSEGEIMDLINTFALKIQRQWRVYLLRKHFKQFINSEIKKRRKSQTKRSSPEVTAFDKLKFDENRIKHLSYLTDNGEEIVSSYNLQKYEQYESSSLTNSKEILNNDPITYRSQSNSDKNSIRLDNDTAEYAKKRPLVPQQKSSFQQSNFSKVKSKQALQSERGDHSYRLREQPILEKDERRISYDSCQLPKRSNLQNRRRSTGDLLSNAKELKQFQIDKAFEIKIIQQSIPIKPVAGAVKKAGENSPAKRGEDEREGFNIKYPFDRALKCKRKEIEDYKQKKLLSIESRFKRKEVTERSYLEICRKIHEEHDNRLEYFREREGEIRSNWSKLLAISKENKPNGKYLEDEQEHLHNSISNIDASVSFDRWDFNSSAKKSLDGNLLEDAHNSKNYSLESVLRYLEEEDTEKEIEDKDKDKDRKFRKKNRQVIEAIAERSKEISDKSVQEFCEVDPAKQVKYQKEKYEILQAIEIEEPSCDKKIQQRQQLNAVTYKIDNNSKVELPAEPSKQPKNVSIDLENQEEKPFESSSKKKIEPKSQSQSLLISQIEAASPSQNIYSDRQFGESGEKTILKQLLFKDFQSAQKQEDTVLKKFIELVNEKYVLSNIKLINSLKFMFAKMGDERKQQQLKAKAAVKFQPIESDINAINTWLLEMSHFILDNYQPVVRENLVNVKQPPALELLALAQKDTPYSSPYETVPEYVFKDFQFYYIKTLARNYGIGADKYDAFSTLLYTFHRSLIDSLNLALMEELISGKRWLQVPWGNEFRQKKRVRDEHAKSCLERSINVVSNWGEYGQGRLEYESDLAELQNKPYEDEKINMVCKEEALDLPLAPTFTQAHILLAISTMIFEEEISSAYHDIFS